MVTKKLRSHVTDAVPVSSVKNKVHFSATYDIKKKVFYSEIFIHVLMSQGSIHGLYFCNTYPKFLIVLPQPGLQEEEEEDNTQRSHREGGGVAS